MQDFFPAFCGGCEIAPTVMENQNGDYYLVCLCPEGAHELTGEAKEWIEERCEDVDVEEQDSTTRSIVKLRSLPDYPIDILARLLDGAADRYNHGLEKYGEGPNWLEHHPAELVNEADAHLGAATVAADEGKWEEVWHHFEDAVNYMAFAMAAEAAEGDRS